MKEASQAGILKTDAVWQAPAHSIRPLLSPLWELWYFTATYAAFGLQHT